MAMGKKKGRQSGLWIATSDLARSPGHPFYERLNRLLAEHGFDARSSRSSAGVSMPSAWGARRCLPGCTSGGS